MSNSIMGAPVLIDDVEAIDAALKVHFPDVYDSDAFLAALGAWLSVQLRAKGEKFSQGWINTLRFNTLRTRLPRP